MSAYHRVQGGEGERGRAHKAKEQRDKKEKKRGEGRAEGDSPPLDGAMERRKERMRLKKEKEKHAFPLVWPLEGFHRFCPHKKISKISQKKD